MSDEPRIVGVGHETTSNAPPPPVGRPATPIVLDVAPPMFDVGPLVDAYLRIKDEEAATVKPNPAQANYSSQRGTDRGN